MVPTRVNCGNGGNRIHCRGRVNRENQHERRWVRGRGVTRAARANSFRFLRGFRLICAFRFRCGFDVRDEAASSISRPPSSKIQMPARPAIARRCCCLMRSGVQSAISAKCRFCSGRAASNLIGSIPRSDVASSFSSRSIAGHDETWSAVRCLDKAGSLLELAHPVH
jgi:hypothetical protein